jgi:hypothetical protein
LVRPYRFLHSRKWNHSIKNNVETMMSLLSATTTKVDPRGGLAVLICFVVGSEAPDEAIRDMPNRAIRNEGSSVGYEPFDRGAMFIVQNLLEICRELAAKGQTIVIVEQNVRAALSLTHRVYVLNNGHMVFEGSTAALQDAPELMNRYLGV